MAPHSEETAEYVAALRTSSGRARFALYVTIVATVLLFIATYNISNTGWPRKRLDTWYSYARGKPGKPPTPAPPREIARGDAERLQELRAEYVKQYIARSIFTTSPIPGVSIDVNDVGLFGGITLTLLMLVLVGSIAREHENVYLAMYKVRRIWETDPKSQSRGDSSANLLYHALVMTQVLSSPPTLARWRTSPWLVAFRVIFLAPALVYGWVVLTEWNSRRVSAAYGVDVVPTVWIEAGVFVVLFFLGMLMWLHSSAMADRWERAFFVVNPVRRLVPQMSVWEWLRVGRGKVSEDYLRRQRLRNVLVERLEVGSAFALEQVAVGPVAHQCKKNCISRAELRQLRDDLMRRGEEAAKAACAAQGREFVSLGQFLCDEDFLDGRRWIVSGRWAYRYRELAAAGVTAAADVASGPATRSAPV